MKNKHPKDVEELFEAILTIQNMDECEAFFEDICTVRELADLAQRLRAAKLLKNGVSYVEITKQTGMSTATISRVNRCLAYGGGGYKLVIDRTENK